MSKISLKEFAEKFLGITLLESQLKLLENPGKMKIGPIRKHGKKNKRRWMKNGRK